MFPRDLVKVNSMALPNVTYYGREAQHDVTLGGDRVFFGTGGAAANPGHGHRKLSSVNAA